MQPIPSHMALVPVRQKHAGGRPTLYWDGYCQQAIDLGREGCSRTEIAAEFGVSRETIGNWEKRHPEFMDAMRYAKQAEMAWWERQGRRGINMGKEFNAAAYCFQ